MKKFYIFGSIGVVTLLVLVFVLYGRDGNPNFIIGNESNVDSRDESRDNNISMPLLAYDASDLREVAGFFDNIFCGAHHRESWRPEA